MNKLTILILMIFSVIGFINVAYGVEAICGDGICDTGYGENYVNSNSYCPEDCMNESCVDKGYKCTSAVMGCGLDYQQFGYYCSGNSICCEDISYCGDGICDTEISYPEPENEGTCPEDCMNESCVDKGYKCTSAVRGCGLDYQQFGYYCPGSSICCEDVSYCGDGICDIEISYPEPENEGTCPEDCDSNYVECEDSDKGKDYYVKGYILYHSGSKSDDFCINENTLREFICSDSVEYVTIECKNGCIDGACIKEDAKDVPSFTIGLDDSAPVSDVILASQIIPELNAAGYKNIPVGATNKFSEINALRLDQKVTLAIYENEAVIIIGETSPSSHVIFGTEIKQILIRKGIDSEVILSSKIESDNIVDLFNCELVATQKEGTTKSYIIKDKSYSVTVFGDEGGFTKYYINGKYFEFVSGELIELSDGTVFTELPVSRGLDSSTFCFLKEDKIPDCKDTDKGKNYYLKGTVTIGSYRRHADYCSNENELVESSCKSRLELDTEIYLCLNGCRDGACVPFEEVVLTEDKTVSSISCPKKTCSIKSDECSGFDKIILEECKLYIEKNGQCEEIITTNSKTIVNGCFDKSTDVFQCQGCQLDQDKCIPYGIRLERNNINYYCDISTKLSEQKENKQSCQNSYECASNNCKSGICASICEGCLDKNNVCIPIGTRTETQYCDVDFDFKNQKSEDIGCNNNYECSTNMCVNNNCISPTLIQAIIDWFKKIFG